MAGPQAWYCHLKGHLRNWATWVNFVPVLLAFSPILLYLWCQFSLSFCVAFLAGITRIFWTRGDYTKRLFLTGITKLKKSQLINVPLFGSMLHNWVTRWRGCVRHGTISRKVAGSIPEVSIRNFHWHKSSSRTMDLRLTQLLTDIGIRNISWGLEAVRP